MSRSPFSFHHYSLRDGSFVPLNDFLEAYKVRLFSFDVTLNYNQKFIHYGIRLYFPKSSMLS